LAVRWASDARRFGVVVNAAVDLEREAMRGQ